MNAQLSIRTIMCREKPMPGKPLKGELMDGRGEKRLVKEGIKSLLRGDGACVNMFIELYDSLDEARRASALRDLVRHFGFMSAGWNVGNENPHYMKETNEIAAVRIARVLEHIAQNHKEDFGIEGKEWETIGGQVSDILHSIIGGGPENNALQFQPVVHNDYGHQDPLQGRGLMLRILERLESPAQTHWWAKALRWVVNWVDNRFQRFDEKCAKYFELSSGALGNHVLVPTPHLKLELASAKVLWALERNKGLLEDFTRSVSLLNWNFRKAIEQGHIPALRIYAYHEEYINRLLQSGAGMKAIEKELTVSEDDRSLFSYGVENIWENLSIADREAVMPLLTRWAGSGSNAVQAVRVAGNNETLTPGDLMDIVNLSFRVRNLNALALAAETESMSWVVSMLERWRMLPFLDAKVKKENTAYQALVITGISDSLHIEDKTRIVAKALRYGHAGALEGILDAAFIRKGPEKSFLQTVLTETDEGKAFIRTIMSMDGGKAIITRSLAKALHEADSNVALTPSDAMEIIGWSLEARDMDALALAAELGTTSWIVSVLERSEILPLLVACVKEDETASQALVIAGVSETLNAGDKMKLVATAFKNGHADALGQMLDKGLMKEDLLREALIGGFANTNEGRAFIWALASIGEGRAFITKSLENAKDKDEVLSGIASVGGELITPLLDEWLAGENTREYALKLSAMLEPDIGFEYGSKGGPAACTIMRY